MSMVKSRAKSVVTVVVGTSLLLRMSGTRGYYVCVPVYSETSGDYCKPKWSKHMD
jgi:hypothetical protein